MLKIVYNSNLKFDEYVNYAVTLSTTVYYNIRCHLAHIIANKKKCYGK